MFETLKQSIDAHPSMIWVGIACLVFGILVFWLLMKQSKKKPDKPKPPKTTYDFNKEIMKELTKDIEEHPDTSFGKILMLNDIVQTGMAAGGKYYTMNPSKSTSKEILRRMQQKDFERAFNDSRK